MIEPRQLLMLCVLVALVPVLVRGYQAFMQEIQEGKLQGRIFVRDPLKGAE